jgi:uncharacterized membrane protein
MYQRFRTYFSHNKYRLAMFIMLGAATVISAVSWRVRFEHTGSTRYAFLLWNLFLAWIPFAIAYFAYGMALRRKWISVVIPAVAFLWLIFFPNAPYILTDFQHLAYHGTQDPPVWYDVMMLFWFALTGLMLGIVSLFLMQEIIRRAFGRRVGWAFVAVVTGLSSAGVYMGRFLRWNSWDILRNPAGIAARSIAHVQDPSLQSIGFISLFGALFLFLYITLYVFGHLLLEKQPDSSRSE